MATIAYHASHEQFAPSHLLELAIRAECADFGAIHSSDHFHPWSKRQGQSGFSFSWIAAAMQATKIPFSMVCAPVQRYHPAIVAQAIATLSEMFPSRFGIELGSGEALNELITGAEWPNKTIRNERLKESAFIIRGLLNGEEVTQDGYVQVHEAKLYTRPVVVPPLFGAALSMETAAWLGTWADGLLTTGGDPAAVAGRVEAFRNNGGRDKPVYIQCCFSYARDGDVALMSAWDQWRSNLLAPEQMAGFHRPEQFDEAARHISPAQVAEVIPILTAVEQISEMISTYEECCRPDRIILHNVNHLQEDFIDDFGKAINVK